MNLEFYCKTRIERETDAGLKRHMNIDDRTVYSEALNSKGPVDYKLKTPSNWDDNDNLISSRSPIKNSDAKLDEQQVAAIKRLQLACQRSFRPIYERLVAPVQIMTRMGYDVSPKRGNLESLNKMPAVGDLYKIKALCEAAMRSSSPVALTIYPRSIEYPGISLTTFHEDWILPLKYEDDLVKAEKKFRPRD